MGFDIDLFLKKAEEQDRGYETPCLIWTAALGGKGSYGTYSWTDNGVHYQFPAHRIAYELFIGSIPEGYEIDHLCQVHECIRHLEAVTRQTNMDRVRERKGICRNGHLKTEENIYRHPRTNKIHGCKACRREAVRRSKGGVA